MSKTWEGPSEALKATASCSIASRLHRRAGEQLIAYDTDSQGTLATVYRLEKRAGEWFRHDLGIVKGGDPMNTIINVALAHTRHDHELFSLIARHIERRTEDVIAALRYCSKKLDSTLTDLGDSVESLARRYV
jgi:hypothetical protein